jgi:hypothetical protein
VAARSFMSILSEMSFQTLGLMRRRVFGDTTQSRGRSSAALSGSTQSPGKR